MESCIVLDRSRVFYFAFGPTRCDTDGTVVYNVRKWISLAENVALSIERCGGQTTSYVQRGPFWLSRVDEVQYMDTHRTRSSLCIRITPGTRLQTTIYRAFSIRNMLSPDNPSTKAPWTQPILILPNQRPASNIEVQEASAERKQHFPPGLVATNEIDPDHDVDSASRHTQEGTGGKDKTLSSINFESHCHGH